MTDDKALDNEAAIEAAMADSTNYLKRQAIEALVTLNTMIGDDGKLVFPHGYLVQCGLEGKSRVLDILMRFIPTPTQTADASKPTAEELLGMTGDEG